jgi:hypothetical protein
VSARRIQTRGLGRPKTLPKPDRGALAPYGYKLSLPASARHQAIVKAAKDKGYAKTIRHLNVIANLMKNSNPGARETLRDDMAYLKRHRVENGLSRKALRVLPRRARHSRNYRKSKK